MALLNIDLHTLIMILGVTYVIPVSPFFISTTLNIVTFRDAIIVSLLLIFGLIIMVNKRLIADMSEARKELQESESRFRSLFENMSEGVALHEMIRDESGAATNYRILDVNQAYEQITGISVSEARGKLATDLYSVESAPYLDNYSLVLQNEQPHSFETHFGEMEKYFFISAIPLKPGYFATIFQDITRRKLLEAETGRLLEKSERSREALLNILEDQLNAQESLHESNELLSLFIRHSPIYAYIKEVSPSESRVLKASENYQDMIGIKGCEMEGKTMFELFPAEFAAKMTADDLDVVSNGVVIKLTEHFNDRIYTTIKYPINLASKTLLAGYTLDITEMKLWENEIQKLNESLEDIFQTVTDGIIYASPDGVILSANTSFERISGIPRDNLVGKHVLDLTRDFLSREIQGNINKHILKIIQGKVDEEFRIEYNDKVLDIKATINRRTGHITAVVRDITDWKKIESRMIQSERLSALGEMSAGMAHEINQPLNTLSITLDNILLEAKLAHGVSEEYLALKSEKIFANILRIRNIIDHVRDFSRRQENTFKSSFNINKSILDAISMVSEQFKIDGIKMITSLDENLPELNGNTYKFEQVVLNLILNSKDALLDKRNRSDGSFEMTIRIRSSFSQEQVLVEVEDNGTGIADKHRDKVLQPFYTTKETGKGTGLGLSVSYGLIREMNGTIEIKSKVMAGTTISIILPLKT